MTGAEFRAKYQLEKALTAQGVRSHLAVQPDGRAVMVHFVEGKSPREQSDLLGRIDHLPPAQRTRIVEIVRVDDTPTVVTEYLQDFETLEAWLGLPSPSPGAQQPETAPAPRDADGPGELTALFGALPDEPDQPPGVAEQGQAPPAATGSAPPEPSPPPADSREDTPPGEFTQLFTPVGDAKPTLIDQPGRPRTTPPSGHHAGGRRRIGSADPQEAARGADPAFRRGYG
jgi:hypothetical protein